MDGGSASGPLKGSTRRLAARTGASQASVHRTLQEQQLYPYCIQSIQESMPHDASPTSAFCRRILQQSAEDSTCTEEVSLAEESCFTKIGITSIHNEHVRSDENYHTIRSYHQQRQFSKNLSDRILGDCLIGPHILVAAIALIFFEHT
jgi:hypothetical protein